MFKNLERESKKSNPILDKGNIGTPKVKVAKSEAQQKQLSRRNIKVYDEAYVNLSALAQYKNMTHTELILWLVSQVTNELGEEQKAIFEHLRAGAEQKLEIKKK